MSDQFIKYANIADGKMVRIFVDHFFTRRFLLNANRNGVRRSKGPSKMKLESYENILKTFHKCIIVGSPTFGYSGTKLALYKLCDTAVQRCKKSVPITSINKENEAIIYEDEQFVNESEELSEEHDGG